MPDQVYFASPNGTSLMRSYGVLPPPPDWVPLTAEEYTTAMAVHHEDYGPVNMLGVASLTQESMAPAKKSSRR